MRAIGSSAALVALGIVAGPAFAADAMVPPALHAIADLDPMSAMVAAAGLVGALKLTRFPTRRG